MDNSQESFYKQINNKANVANRLLEMSYEGNIGFEEVMKFFQLTDTPEKKHIWDQFEALLSKGDKDSLILARQMMEKEVGVKLQGN